MGLKNQITTSDHLKYDEYLKLLDGLHRDEEYFFELYARLSFCTACRASDVLNFRWQDVVGVKKCTVVEKKTGKTRVVPFNDTVQAKILQLYRLMGEPKLNQFVFFNPYKERAVTIQYINQHLKKLKYKYGLSIEHFSTHTFRKTFGRYVYDIHNHSAESLLLLNKIFRHSNIDITKRYIGITQDEINEVFDSIAF